MSNIASPGSGGLELMQRIDCIRKIMEYEEFQVTVSSANKNVMTAKGYKKNGVVVIDIGLKAGAYALMNFGIPEKYGSKSRIEGSFTPIGTGSDAGKCAGVQIDGTSGFVWITSALTATCHASIVYPI